MIISAKFSSVCPVCQARVEVGATQGGLNMVNVRATASNSRPTSTGASFRGASGIDLDVTLTLAGGRVVAGEVTLLPREDGWPGYSAWGQPDNWVSRDLLDAIRDMDRSDYSDALDVIEDAAVNAAPLTLP